MDNGYIDSNGKIQMKFRSENAETFSEKLDFDLPEMSDAQKKQIFRILYFGPVNQEIISRINNGFKISNNKTEDGSPMWVRHDPNGRYVDIISHGAISYLEGSKIDKGQEGIPLSFIQRYYFGLTGEDHGYMGDSVVLLNNPIVINGIEIKNGDSTNSQHNLIIGKDSSIKAIIDNWRIHVRNNGNYEFVRNSVNIKFLASLGINITGGNSNAANASQEIIKIESADLERRIQDRNKSLEEAEHLLQVRRDAMKEGKGATEIARIESDIVKELAVLAGLRPWFTVETDKETGKHWLVLKKGKDVEQPSRDLLARIMRKNESKGWDGRILIDFDAESKGTAALADDKVVHASIGTLMKALTENSFASTIVFSHESVHVIDRYQKKIWKQINDIRQQLAGIKAENETDRNLKIGGQMARARNPKADNTEIESAAKEYAKVMADFKESNPQDALNIANQWAAEIWKAQRNTSDKSKQKGMEAPSWPIGKGRGIAATSQWESDTHTVEKATYERILTAKGWSDQRIKEAMAGLVNQQYLEALGDGSSALKKSKFYYLGGRPFHDSGEYGLAGFQEKERKDIFAALNGGVEIGIYAAERP